jgi:hypothetical protein
MDKTTKDRDLRVPVSSREKTAIENAAKKVGLPTATWIRQLLLRHIKDGVLLTLVFLCGCGGITNEPDLGLPTCPKLSCDSDRGFNLCGQLLESDMGNLENTTLTTNGRLCATNPAVTQKCLPDPTLSCKLDYREANFIEVVGSCGECGW